MLHAVLLFLPFSSVLYVKIVDVVCVSHYDYSLQVHEVCSFSPTIKFVSFNSAYFLKKFHAKIVPVEFMVNLKFVIHNQPLVPYVNVCQWSQAIDIL